MLKALRDLMTPKSRVLLTEEWSGCMGDGLCVWSYNRQTQKTYTQDTPPMIEPVVSRLSEPLEVPLSELEKIKESLKGFDLGSSYGVSSALRALTLTYGLHQDSRFQEFYLRYQAMEKRVGNYTLRHKTAEYSRGKEMVENFLMGVEL